MNPLSQLQTSTPFYQKRTDPAGGKMSKDVNSTSTPLMSDMIDISRLPRTTKECTFVSSSHETFTDFLGHETHLHILKNTDHIVSALRQTTVDLN